MMFPDPLLIVDMEKKIVLFENSEFKLLRILTGISLHF